MKVLRFRNWRLLLLTKNEVFQLRYFVDRVRDPDFPIIPCDDKACGYTMCDFVTFLKEDA